VVTRFVEWLKEHNAGIPHEERYSKGAGFYGLDLYSLHESGTEINGMQLGHATFCLLESTERRSTTCALPCHDASKNWKSPPCLGFWLCDSTAHPFALDPSLPQPPRSWSSCLEWTRMLPHAPRPGSSALTAMAPTQWPMPTRWVAGDWDGVFVGR
jgi:hypothetical protein